MSRSGAETSRNLTDLITSEIGPPLRRGRQAFWRCPFHKDHNPSLTITPDGRRWKCFGCQRTGDAIAWIRERTGCSFREAQTRIGEPLTLRTGPPGFNKTSVPAISRPPNLDPEWQPKAESVANECAGHLFDESAVRARVWLVNRGLRAETLKHWRVGYNPKSDKRHRLWIEQGITLPWFIEGRISAINVRRPVGDPKYKMAAGSSRRGLYLGDEIMPGRPTLLVEGEFDALLAWQFTRDTVNVATLGSASTRPDQLAVRQLITSPLILVVYDADVAGQENAKFWSALSPRIHRAPVPSGKDITEFHQRGGDLAFWIRWQLGLAGYNTN